ncbi:hypothetical protein C1H76_3027 [Elsinoe australis]|uniref:CBM-cenC domain-containing protein n=1 Tax=Elsinoe australis TaxID=40998 RepID=A0A4V6DUJ5_9PEZI|nr:hypothetical protein C1H76_3027 [Elsinoe australis]
MFGGKVASALLLAATYITSSDAAAVTGKATTTTTPKVLNPSFEIAGSNGLIAANWTYNYRSTGSKGARRVVNKKAAAQGSAYLQLSARASDPDTVAVTTFLEGLAPQINYTLSGSYRVSGLPSKATSSKYGVLRIQCGKTDFDTQLKTNTAGWRNFSVNVWADEVYAYWTETHISTYGTGDVNFDLDLDNFSIKKSSSSAKNSFPALTLPSPVLSNPSFETTKAASPNLVGWTASDKAVTIKTDATAQSGKSYMRIPFASVVNGYKQVEIVSSDATRNFDPTKFYTFSYYVRSNVTSGSVSIKTSLDKGTGTSKLQSSIASTTYDKTSASGWQIVTNVGNAIQPGALTNKLTLTLQGTNMQGWVDIDSFSIKQSDS